MLGAVHHRPRLAAAGSHATSPCSSSIGILGGIGQILLTQCYRYADTSIIAPFEYTTMIWALLFGWFIFGDLPTLAVLIGAVIVAGAGLFVVWREHQLGLLRTKELQASPAETGCLTRKGGPAALPVP